MYIFCFKIKRRKFIRNRRQLTKPTAKSSDSLTRKRRYQLNGLRNRNDNCRSMSLLEIHMQEREENEKDKSTTVADDVSTETGNEEGEMGSDGPTEQLSE